MMSLLVLLILRNLLEWSSASASLDKLSEGIVVEDELSRSDKFGDFPGGKMPTPEELLGMLDSMNGLSDDDKESIRRDILKNTQDHIGTRDENNFLTTSFFTSQFFVLFAFLSLITFIFVFFGYKLYKSLSEREKKREDKKKNKQMKKKK